MSAAQATSGGRCMIAQNQRQRAARIYPWVLAGLVVVFGLLSAYHFFFRQHFTSDPFLMQQLQAAALKPSADRPSAGDWPQWRGPNRDGISAETGLLTRW